MASPLGLHWLVGGPEAEGTAALLIHGFASRGYEWVEAAHAPLAPNRAFYRWDWLQCPASAAVELTAQMNSAQSRMTKVPSLVRSNQSET